MPKRVLTRNIKSNYMYTYEEAGEVVGVTSQTIRTWRDGGLRILDAQRPHGVMGFDLKYYIDKRTESSKRPLRDDEFYCLTCKVGRRPAGAMADYVPITDSRGQLRALCEVCEGVCNRIIRAADIPRWSEKLEIATCCATNA